MYFLLHYLCFLQSKRKGCTAVELDLRLTKDNIPIIFHDPTLERLTGKMGMISDMTWEELREFDITYNHPLKYDYIYLIVIVCINAC